MGIVNVTPDSFSGDGVMNPQIAIDQAMKMIADGAVILDVGGESSRPGSDPVDSREEQRRTLPIVEHLVKNTKAIVSVDTYHPETAEAALKAGVHMINDISGLRDSAMAPIIAQYQAGVVIMHMQGTPKTMQTDPQYDDVVREINDFFSEAIKKANAASISDDQIILDPGIGFGKTLEHNLTILRHLSAFKHPFGDERTYPVLVGVSRKGFIGKLTGKDNAQDRVFGTAAAVAIAIQNGANIVRVHDVAAMNDVVVVASALSGPEAA